MKLDLVVKMQFGSHLYGLNTPDSDVDYKGIFLPNRRDFILGRAAKTYKQSTGDDKIKNTAGDIDFDAYSIHEFIRLALAGETVALDMLHARDENIVYLPERDASLYVWPDLQNHREKFYSKDMKAYLGYVRRQAHKYGVKGSRLASARAALHAVQRGRGDIQPYIDPNKTKLGYIWSELPVGEHAEFTTDVDKTGVERRFYQVCGRKLQDTLPLEEAIRVLERLVDSYGNRAKQAEDNEGIDWKAISHALRAGYQLRSIYKHGDFEYPLEETSFILEVKRGRLDFKTEVQPELESIVSEVETLADKSSLPNKPNHKFWEDWLIMVMEELIL